MVAYGSSRLWRVYHDRYVLCGCRAAAADWRYRGKLLSLNDGSLMLMEPGEMHCNTTVHKPADFKVLMIDPERFKSAAKELGLSGTPHFGLNHVEDSRLLGALYRFSAAVEAGDGVLEQQSWFALCVSLFLGYAERTRSRLNTTNAQHAVQCAKNYLQERFCEPVGLDELSLATGLSRFHLVHAFTRRVGLPPHAYQICMRIARGCTLLRAGIPVADIAMQLGFADQSHFARHFKRIWGTTPGDYVQARRKTSTVRTSWRAQVPGLSY
jgi:AraC-like DNA-binding protein